MPGVEKENWIQNGKGQEHCESSMCKSREVGDVLVYLRQWRRTVWQEVEEKKVNWRRDWKDSESEVAQSCLTLCHPMDCSLWGSSIHGIFQARVLEWVAIFFSRGSSLTHELNTGLQHGNRMILPSEPPGKHRKDRWKDINESNYVGPYRNQQIVLSALGKHLKDS